VGTKRYKSRFLSFHEARKKARTLGLKSRKEWEQLCHSPKRPIDIPVLPHLTYKRDGWISWADFLGYKSTERFLPFDKAREFVRRLGLKTRAEWTQYSCSGKRPKNIPSWPDKTYKKEFKGLRDWLGLPPQRFLTFTQARKYVRENMTGRDWWEWSKTHRPSNIPSRPHLVYKDKGWKGWTNWFGENENRFLPYKKAKALARTLGIKSKREWDLLCKLKRRPREIPACPDKHYKEFIGYPDFFGYKPRYNAKKA
jgi:hypothetical protein